MTMNQTQINWLKTNGVVLTRKGQVMFFEKGGRCVEVAPGETRFYVVEQCRCEDCDGEHTLPGVDTLRAALALVVGK